MSDVDRINAEIAALRAENADLASQRTDKEKLAAQRKVSALQLDLVKALKAQRVARESAAERQEQRIVNVGDEVRDQKTSWLAAVDRYKTTADRVETEFEAKASPTLPLAVTRAYSEANTAVRRVLDDCESTYQDDRIFDLDKSGKCIGRMQAAVAKFTAAAEAMLSELAAVAAVPSPPPRASTPPPSPLPLTKRVRADAASASSEVSTNVVPTLDLLAAATSQSNVVSASSQSLTVAEQQAMAQMFTLDADLSKLTPQQTAILARGSSQNAEMMAAYQKALDYQQELTILREKNKTAIEMEKLKGQRGISFAFAQSSAGLASSFKIIAGGIVVAIIFLAYVNRNLPYTMVWLDFGRGVIGDTVSILSGYFAPLPTSIGRLFSAAKGFLPSLPAPPTQHQRTCSKRPIRTT